MDRYEIEMIVDYGTERIRACDPGSRVDVIKALHDGIIASRGVDAKVTIVVKDPDGRETIHRYADGKKVILD